MNAPRYIDILEFSCGGAFPDKLARIRVDQVMDRKVAMQVFQLILEAKVAQQKAEEQQPETPAATPPDPPAPEASAPAPTPPPAQKRESHRMVPARVKYRPASMKARDAMRRALRRHPKRTEVLRGRQINTLPMSQLRGCLIELGLDIDEVTKRG